MRFTFRVEWAKQEISIIAQNELEAANIAAQKLFPGTVERVFCSSPTLHRYQVLRTYPEVNKILVQIKMEEV